MPPPPITSRKVGTAGPHQQPAAYGLTTSGFYTTVDYESTDAAAIDALALVIRGYNLPYDVKHGFGKSTITVKYNYDWQSGSGDPATEMIEKWESVPMKSEKGILTSINPLTLKVLNAGHGYQLDVIRRFIESGSLEDLIDIDPDTHEVSFTPPADVTDNNAILLLRYYFDGQRTLPFSVPCLKHSRIVNSSFISPATVPNAQTLYSTAGLISAFNIPNGILVQLPSNDSALFTIPVSPHGGFGNQTFGYGWMRSAPETPQISNFKWQLSETFEYGLWGLDFFNGRIPDVTL